MLKTHLPFVESMRTGILRSGKPRPRTPSYWGAPPRLGSPRHTSPKTRSTYPLPACPREKTRRPEERKEVTAELGFGIHELHLGRPAEAGRPTSTRCGAEGKRPSLRGRVFVLARLHGERALTLLKGGQRPCGVCVGDLRLPMIAFLRPSLTACLYHGPLLEHSSTPSVPPLALATGEEDSCDRGGVSGLSVLCRVGVVWGWMDGRMDGRMDG